MKKFLQLFLCVFLLSSSLKAQTLPTMPEGGPDHGAFNVSGRHPAGATLHTSFYSQVAGKNVDMWVYTPPGYNTNEKYGVVYCYQGIGVDAGYIFFDWCVKAPIICDNLIGDGKISKGVIIVAIDDQFNGNNSNVNDMTIRDAIPYIDSHYSTYADADHRGLYGYSWGGGYTFNVGCANLDYFHYLSPTAAAPNKAGDNTLFPNGGAYAKQVMKLLFISWGQYDYQSIKDANTACVNYCNANGIPYYKWETQGQGHTAGVWRPAMWNFLQLADRAGISRDGGTCTPTTIIPYIQVNDGTWQQISSVTVNSGDTVKFGPQPVSGGSWSWNGGSTSGTSREQTIYPISSFTAKATYTNSTGCNSTQNFTVNVSGSNTGNVMIQNKATMLYIDGMGRSSNGDNAGQWSSSTSNNQKWVKETSGSNVRFKNVATGLYLDGMGRSSDGSLTSQWGNSSSSNQQWTIETSGSYSRIKNVATGLYLDGMGWSTNGSDLGQYRNSGSDAQQWTITSLKSARANSVELSTVNEGPGNITLFPNPFTTKANIKIDNPEQVTSIVVFDMLGKQVEIIGQGTVKNEQAIGSSLKAGMYIVQICSPDKIQSFKILKK
jgi:enterochelin esterase family protein